MSGFGQLSPFLSFPWKRTLEFAITAGRLWHMVGAKPLGLASGPRLGNSDLHVAVPGGSQAAPAWTPLKFILPQ